MNRFSFIGPNTSPGIPVAMRAAVLHGCDRWPYFLICPGHGPCSATLIPGGKGICTACGWTSDTMWLGQWSPSARLRSLFPWILWSRNEPGRN